MTHNYLDSSRKRQGNAKATLEGNTEQECSAATQAAIRIAGDEVL